VEGSERQMRRRERKKERSRRFVPFPPSLAGIRTLVKAARATFAVPCGDCAAELVEEERG
jgi:hypothetical protein